MAKTKEIRPEDIERELPPAEDSSAEAVSENGQPEAAGGELARLAEERDSLRDRLARQQAEFENFRKRNQREQQEFRDYAVFEAVRSLLPVIDSLDLALKNSQGQQNELHSGVELTRKQLFDALTKLGLSEVPALGEAFDPQFHQAIEMVETNEVPDHQIIGALQSGYKMKGRLLRPAMVRVASNKKSDS